MHRGYIKLWRRLRESDLWLSEPFTRGQAWVDLLMLANHKDGQIRKRGIPIDVHRGQIGWSEEALGARWHWSRGKVRRFMSELSQKTVQQIEQQKNNLTSLICIINWDQYQGDGTTNDTTDDTTNGHQTDTKRYRKKNDKNEKNKNIPDPRVKIFLNWYAALYQRKFKCPYVVSWPKDSSLVKPLIASVPWLDLQYAAVWFVRVQDDFISGNGEKLGAGYGIGMFKTRINECLRHIDNGFKDKFSWITVNEKGESNENMGREVQRPQVAEAQA